MIKKRIKFKDFNGEDREEDFYFNLTKTEIINLELGTTGGIKQLVKKLIDTKDTKLFLDLFNQLIDMSYGVRSDDGKRFIKRPELTAEFKDTLAYDELFMEFMKDPDKFNTFFMQVVPSDVVDNIDFDNLAKTE